MSSETLRVLYILASGRSGSTVLERVLGQLASCHAGGELCHVWRRGFVEDQLCGCRETFWQCPFWERVREEAGGGFDRTVADVTDALLWRVGRLRHIPLILSGRYGRAFAGSLDEYRDYLDRLYGGLHRACGGKVIIDSSKDGSLACILRSMPNVELHLIHLVRDSRAVAHSWQRKRKRPEIHWKDEYMPCYGIRKSAKLWNHVNLVAELLKRGSDWYDFVRYEDMMDDPVGVIASLNCIRRLGIGSAEIARAVSGTRINHTISGNPVRFEQGSLKLVKDEEWRHAMLPAKRLATTALTFPLLARYGYLRASDR